MTVLYWLEDQFFQDHHDAVNYQKRFRSARIEKIETEKDFDQFVADFEQCREEGNSIADSIEWAK